MNEPQIIEIEQTFSFTEMCDLMAKWNENARAVGSLKEATITLKLNITPIMEDVGEDWARNNGFIHESEAHEYCNEGREY